KGRFLPPGIYYWRLLSEKTKADSQPMRLVILPALKAPETYSPLEGENIIIEEGIPLDFRWEKLDYADSYDFKLFSTGNPVPLYEVSSLRDTVVQAYFNTDTAGRYRWTIQANMEDLHEMSRKRGLIKENYFSIGSSEYETVPGFVRGVIKAGAVHAPISLIVPWNGVSLYNSGYSASQVRWSANEALFNTRVIFSRDLDPASDPKAIIYYAGDDAASMALPPLGEGVWYWIVQGNTITGQGLSAAAPSWFTIVPPPPLDSPKYLNPLDDVVITLDQLMDSRKLMFQWEEVPDANAYIFTLFDTLEHKMLITSPPREETFFELYDLAILTANDYNWQVEAVNISRNGAIERRGIIKESSFMVDISRSDNLHARVQGTGYGY
ncbi:MAG: hypothetical protein FWH35_09370, partial [Treponema sp.]|nr:hypothetical protein [Treponema sp.]